MRHSALLLTALGLLSGACSHAAARTEPLAAKSVNMPAALGARSAASLTFPAPADVVAPPAGALLGGSGLATKVLAPGSGTLHPELNDCVRLRFTSWKRDGSLRGSSGSADAPPLTQCLRRVMPGLREALQQMVVGEQRRLWLPASLTYREDDADAPPPRDDLTLDVLLVEVLKAPATPTDLNGPPKNTLHTASGLALRVLTPGSGVRHPLPADRMRVRFTGWTSQGVLFESTDLGGRPASVTRADVVAGVGEGLALMQIGEKCRAWLPAALAFGDQPRHGRPAGNLVYDLELLAIE